MGEAISSNVMAYLNRINYTGTIDLSPETLARLQEQHIKSVPYENLDIWCGVPLSLEITDLYNKIVINRRGGYCFELNALFGWLLRQLGFKVTDLFARFWRDETVLPPKRRHHVLLVDISGKRFLCDVGVGGVVPLRPIQVIEQVAQQQNDEAYQLKRDENYGWMLNEQKDDSWRLIYSFTEEPQLLIDYYAASYWCESAPHSPFKESAIAAIRTEDGRHTLKGIEFRTFTAEGVSTYIPQTEDEFIHALKTYFGISLSNLPASIKFDATKPF
ncbi:arylamine N-acetyltransferase [Paenibacillus sp. NPDC056579]|uniref:arylamine N-acetyltransferase family protein n=1 Tax=Paenibacillus sp. NPDC056579 TaxID=3345871 RepID=UPI0036BEC764